MYISHRQVHLELGVVAPLIVNAPQRLVSTGHVFTLSGDDADRKTVSTVTANFFFINRMYDRRFLHFTLAPSLGFRQDITLLPAVI